MNTLSEKDCVDFKPLAENSSAKVVRVLDGDTIVIAWLANNVSVKSSVRLYGINAAEVHTKNLQEKQVGLQMKAELEKIVLNKIVTLYDISKDKYGRILAKLACGNIQDVSNYMLQFTNGIKPYFGDKKKEWIFDENETPNLTAFKPSVTTTEKQSKKWYIRPLKQLWRYLIK